MKITFHDGSSATFELRHIYKGEDQKLINDLHRKMKLLTDAIGCCKLCGDLATEDEFRAIAGQTVEGLKETVREIKGKLTWFKKRPIKTICTFEYGGIKTTAHSSISREDALLYKHSAKIGRQAAIRNLLRALGPQTGKILVIRGKDSYEEEQTLVILSKDKRVEVVQALKSQM